MSALCLMFDININIKKLRLFLLQYGDETSPAVEPKLVIRTSMWENTVPADGSSTENTHVLSLKSEGELKFVGVTHTLSRYGLPNAQYIETEAYVNQVCRLLTSKKANALSNMSALRQHVYNKVAYTAKLSSYSLKQTDQQHFKKHDIRTHAPQICRYQ